MSETSTAPAAASGIRAAPAALIGVLAVGAAVGAGQLVAGLLAPGSAPFLAVGDAAVRLAPPPVVEFAKNTFGTADKPVLLAGAAAVLVLLGVLAGLASRRRPGPGAGVLAGLGLVGFAAVAAAPAFAPLDLLAPAAALGAGLAAFHWLHRSALPVDRTEQPAPAGPTRRSVLVGGATTVGALSLAAGAGGWWLGGREADARATAAARLAGTPLSAPAPVIPADAAFPAAGTPPFLTPNPDFYRIDTALRVPSIAVEDWSLRVHGLVERELTLTYADLLARPLVARPVTLTCVSNPVGGDLISTAVFTGVELGDVLRAAGIRPGADQLLSTSSDGWTAGTPIDVLLEPDRGALLALAMNGEPLPAEHGFPVRMVVPGLYGYVSATKWVTDLEVTTFDAAAAYWVRRGWAQRAPVKTQSRIDRPRDGTSVSAGRVTVAGIAWAQHRGVDRVEIQLDDGEWRRAELAADVSRDTWRLWKLDLDVGVGSHTVRSRTTDRTGETQTATVADVVPDGATGWPSVLFTAT